MKKVTMFLLAVLLIASLFVSCDNNAKTVVDEHVTVSFSTGVDGRSLGYEIENITNLKWHYSANKTNQDDVFKFGETNDTTIIDWSDEIELSQGKWDFTLWANKVDESGTEGAKVYEGSVTGVLITKETSPKSIVINVSPEVAGESGSIVLQNITVSLRDGSSTTVYPQVAIIEGVEDGELTLTNGCSAEKTGLQAGDYSITVKYREVIDGTPVTYASEKIVVTVWSGRTTTIEGNISEITGSATLDKKIIQTDITQVNTVSEGETTFTLTGLAPSNNTESSEVKDTVVTFPAGTLSAGENAKLQVKVNSIDSDFSFSVPDSSSTVGSISLKLNDQESSSFGESSVTITTYIAKGLSGVAVKYNGNGDQPGDVTVTTSTGSSNVEGNYYESDTGKLVFSTKHFSEYYVVADEVEAYNSNKNMVYEYLQDAINAVESGDTIILLKDVKLTIQNSEDCIQIKETMTLDGNHFRIYCEDSTLPDNARLVNITGIKNKDITIKNITIESANYGTWMRGLNLYQVDNINLNIVDSVIQIPHYYALNIATECTNTTISIDSTTIRGWATVYNHSSGVNLTANNSTFDSVNPTLGGGDTNSFGNVVVAEYYNCNGSGDSKNNNFVFNNCEFTADKLHPEANVNQVVFDVRSPFKNTLKINSCSFSNLATPEYIKVCYDTTYEDDEEKRNAMKETNELYIDGELVDCETLEYIDYYLDE